MARWPSPRPIPILLPIWHKAKLPIDYHQTQLGSLVDSYSLHHQTPTKAETRRDCSFAKTSPQFISPFSDSAVTSNLSYSRSTPLNRCGRSQRFALPHRKTTRYHRARCYISPCPRRSGRPVFVRRRNCFDRPSWNERGILMEIPLLRER
jgi:hypothetical protein